MNRKYYVSDLEKAKYQLNAATLSIEWAREVKARSRKGAKDSPFLEELNAEIIILVARLTKHLETLPK